MLLIVARVGPPRVSAGEPVALRPAGLRDYAPDSLHTLRMDEDTYRDEFDTDQPDSSQPDSYWRRRVIALAAGLSVLGLLAWALSGGGGKPATPLAKSSQASGVLPAAAYSGPATSPSASAGADGSGTSGAGRSGSAASTPTISGLPSATPSASKAADGKTADGKTADSKTADGKATARKSAAAKPADNGTAATSGGACSPSAVVLSLFTTKAEYDGGQYPEFDVFAVSTAAGTCAFQTGPAKLHVVVMSAGRIIWDSADCAKPGSSRTAKLSRGVPVQEEISWNHSINLPGCVTLASSARPGTYEVQARGAATASPVRTFKLARS